MFGGFKKNIILDVALNYLALILGGTSGILINILISKHFGPSGLGSFQIAYAVYIVMSQFAVCGIHQSTLRHLPLYAKDPTMCSTVAWAACFLSVGVSFAFVLICSAVFLGINAVSPILNLSAGPSSIAGALIFFSCNKVILLNFNALKWMCPLAFWQATRFALMLFFVYIVSSNSNDVSSVSFCFLLTEFFLFIGLVITQLKRLPDMTRGFNRLWLEKHFTFGVKSLMNGVLFEFNTKVDILILGLFTDLKTVGLYSFAAVLLEGILGLYVVIKNQISPYLVQYFDEKKFNTIFDLLKKVSLFSFTVSFLILIATLIFYTSIVGDILQLPEFNESKYFFIILCIGLCFYSIVAPFDNIFLLTSHPLQQSYFAAVMIGSNIGLNFLLTPLWGGYGAAIATACAYFISFLWILLSMKKYINRVFLNRRH